MDGLRRHWKKLLVVVLLASALGTIAYTLLPGRTATPTATYHCPMHPSYTSDRPGDCPVCGMRLVPVGGKAAGAKPPAPAPTSDSHAPDHAITDLYICTMCPEVKHEGPGRCPKCGMDLVKAKAEAPVPHSGGMPASESVPGMTDVHASAEQISLAGVRTVSAVTDELTGHIRAVGNVTSDERRVRQVTTKLAGWVEKLHVNAVGDYVKTGEPLFDLYSPELLASQEEYLRARRTAAGFERSPVAEVRQGGQDLAAAARTRLELFDVPADFIARLEREGVPQRTITFRAAAAGYVTEKMVLEGQRVEAGMPLMTLTDFSAVWVVADIYENEAAAVTPGRRAYLTPQYDGTTRIQGRVAFVYPTMDVESRTMKVRFEVANPKLALKPGMFVNVELEDLRTRGVVVPESAVMDTGTRQVVFVKAAGGQFQPREISAGARAGGRVVVRSGLADGDVVAVAANFLLDSESRLRAAIGSPDAGR